MWSMSSKFRCLNRLSNKIRLEPMWLNRMMKKPGNRNRGMNVNDRQLDERDGSRSGSALVLVLVVITMLSLGAYTYSELMTTEYRAAIATGHQHASLAWAESGVEYVASLLTADGGGWEEDLYDNPNLFHVPIQEGGGFTVVAPVIDQNTDAPIRMGLVDESGKINLNAIARLDPSTPVARNLLLGLPNMTEFLADSILDWIDADEETREYGAEAESNSIVPPRNGPLQNLEELLLIEGVTAELLYGEDVNQNGLLDASERDGELSMPYDNGDDVLDKGWVDYLTLISKEHNLQTAPDYYGQPRINVNETLLTDLYDQLEERMGPDEALFVTAYRLNGPYDPNAPPSTREGNNPGGAPGGSAGGSPGGNSGGPAGGSGSGAGGSGAGSGGPEGSGSGGSGSGGGGRGSGGASGSGGSNAGGSSGSSGASGTGSGSSTSGGAGGSSQSGTSGSSRPRSSGLSLELSNVGSTSSTGDEPTDEALLEAAAGLASALGGGSGEVTRGGLNLTAGPSTTITSIYELLGAQVAATINDQEVILESPWRSDPGSLQQILPELLDTLSTVTNETITGRININEAPLEILMGIPEMPDGLAEEIVATRGQHVGAVGTGGARSASAGWLLIDGLVDAETMAKLDLSITGGGHVFKVQVVGHGDRPGPMARVEAVIDATQSVPKILSFRNLSDVGVGFRHSDLPRFSETSSSIPNNR